MTAAASVPVVVGFYDERSAAVQYVVSCPATGRCAIVDPVLDFDGATGSVATRSADALLSHVAERGLEVEWILDTHPHADHLSAMDYLRARTGAPTAIGARVRDVQAIWKEIYDWPDFPCDGSQWDRLLLDGERFMIGALEVETILSPGHTKASITYRVGDAAFVHDTLFMPDTGTARADFPGGSAADLYASVERILAFAPTTRLFVGHDYKQGGRPARWESTVAEQRATNIHFAARPTLDAFVALREARDATLPIPRMMLLALQVNLRAGRLPEPSPNGRTYLQIPVNAFAGARWS